MRGAKSPEDGKRKESSLNFCLQRFLELLLIPQLCVHGARLWETKQEAVNEELNRYFGCLAKLKRQGWS